VIISLASTYSLLLRFLLVGFYACASSSLQVSPSLCIPLTRWVPKLRRLDLSANPFPARAAAYAGRSALRARRQDRKNTNPILFNEPPVKVNSLQLAADGTPKR